LRAGGASIWIGCGWPGRAWPWVEQPSKASGSAQVSSSVGLVGQLDGLGRFAGQVEHGASTLA
jgi:hypothetical protein